MRFAIAITILLAAVVSAQNQLTVELIAESLCPYCIQLITTSVAKATAADGFFTMVNLTIVPYGNAQEAQQGSQWVFTCQHGPQECVGNTVENCAINYYGFNATFWAWLSCLETEAQNSGDFYGAGSTCATKHSLSWSEVETCAKGPEGNQLTHAAAVATNNLNPPHQYTPWIITNGQHNVNNENEITTSLLNWACKNYKGTKPPCCSSVDLFLE